MELQPASEQASQPVRPEQWPQVRVFYVTEELEALYGMLEGTAVGEFFNSRRRFPCSILQIRIDRKGQARKGKAHLARASQ